jgi:biopolymer transport protein ExbD
MDAADFDSDEMITEINMTPLVDISLVLVIIFMVIAPFLSHVLKPLNLPMSAKATLTDQNTIKVSVFPDGTLAVGATVMDDAQLEGAITNEIKAGKKPWVLVRAGVEVPHGRVMDVVKIIQRQKIERLAFAARPKAAAEALK